MSNSKRFSGHDKRVTLQLARLSTAADQDPAFAAVLNQLPALGFDVNQLDQEGQEILFAEFDDALETRIKSEFVADPSYVVDLGHAMGVCPLCGHVGCRWLFRITNIANGNEIECGSECIVTHGLCVKGAETAEHARRALEATIRRAIKAIKIKAWHEAMAFTPELFGTLAQGLEDVYKTTSLPYQIRNSAWYKAKKDLPKLRKFYERSGWLNTEKRWKEWTRLVSFARKFDPHARKVMNHPLPHGHQAGKAVELNEAPEPVEAPEAPKPTVETIVEVTKPEAPKTESLPQSTPAQLTFGAIANELVFG